MEEASRKRNRDFKKVTSISYIGNPPVITREVDSIGLVARTTGEVRDTDFPILASIEDLTDNIQTVIDGTTKTIQVELGKAEAQFHRLLLDDDAGSITDFVINFVGLAKNKALEFIADIETLFGGTPNITFNPPLIGLPSAFGDAGNDEFKLLISAIDTPTVSAFEVLNGADGGGAGVSFPIDFPEEQRGNVTGPTEVIDFTQSDRHAVIMTLTADIGISLTNTTAGKLQITSIKLKQDNIGGHAFTGFNELVANEQAIIDAVAESNGPNEFVSFVVEFEDGLFTAYFKSSNVIVGGGGLNADLSNMTSPTIPPVDLNMNQHDILGVTNLDFDGSFATIEGLVNLNFFQTDQEIDSLSDRLLYQIATAQFHDFVIGGISALRIIDVGGSVLRLDLLDNSIEDVQDIRFNPASGSTVFIGTDPAIGFDSSLGTPALKINVPTGAEVLITENNVIGSTVITSGQVESNLMTVQNLLQLGTISLGVPASISGSFANDGTDTFVFSGGVVRNLSDIGAAGSEVPIWTQDHDADGYNFIVDIDGDSFWKGQRDGLDDDWMQLLMGGDIMMNISNRVGNEWLRIGFNLEPESNTQTLGSILQPWEQAYIDSHIDFDSTTQATIGTPTSTHGFIYWNDSTSSFHQIDDVGTDTDLSSASAGANLQLDNLVDPVKINRSFLANRVSSGIIGDDNSSDAFLNIWTDKISFANQASIPSDKHVIGRITTTNNLVINAPLNESIDLRINGISQIITDGSDVDFSEQNLIDIADIGSSLEAIDNLYAEVIRWPTNNAGIQNAHNIYRNSVGGTNTMILNVPSNEDWMVTENGATGSALLHLDTSANLLVIGANASILGMNLNDKSIGFVTGIEMEFNSTNGFKFEGGDTSFDNNDVLNIGTATANNFLRDVNTGMVMSTELLLLKAENSSISDVAVTADDAVFVQLNATGRMGFFGSAITKPTITGSRAGNIALANLLTQLESYGLIVDSTT